MIQGQVRSCLCGPPDPPVNRREQHSGPHPGRGPGQGPHLRGLAQPAPHRQEGDAANPEGAGYHEASLSNHGDQEQVGTLSITKDSCNFWYLSFPGNPAYRDYPNY